MENVFPIVKILEKFTICVTKYLQDYYEILTWLQSDRNDGNNFYLFNSFILCSSQS